MEAKLFTDIVIVLTLSIAAMFICLKAKIPSVVGLLAVGVLSGPSGAGLIGASSQVEIVAELGVVMLMFTIGLEFSLKDLMKIKRSVLLNGGLQVAVTAVVVFGIARAAGLEQNRALFAGMLASLSSTAIVLKVIQDRAEIDTSHGRGSLAILIFQDIAVVPLVLLLPLLSGQSADTGTALAALLGKAVAAVVLVLAAARWVVPFILFQVTRTRSRELFILTIVALCALVTWLTHMAQLSIALGAFLAGLIISESEYSHQALGNILPFKDVFTGFFFISIGMLIDIDFFLGQPFTILGLSAGVILTKALVIVLIFSLVGQPLRIGLLTGFALCQIGEFSFILAKAGTPYLLISPDHYQLFLNVATLTMMATPLLISSSHWIAGRFEAMPLPAVIRKGYLAGAGGPDESGPEKSQDHMIIVGFGINGKNVARAASYAGIPYIIIEMNPDTVKEEKSGGENILYGDSTQELVLEYAGIERARVIVITIADAPAARRTTAVAREMNPSVYIITRTRFMGEVGPLHELGADEVIPEEFETAVEIFSRVMKKYMMPYNEILRLVGEIRSGNYGLFDDTPGRDSECTDIGCYLPGMEVSSYLVEPHSFLSGQTLAETGLRKRYGLSVLAVKKGDTVVPNPSAEMRIDPGDMVVLMGSPERIHWFVHQSIENVPG
ncbi:MAG TPA: potassium transporter KefB, partial [Spirochaetes bacterium]|nr:potassium transporter KefB [Spirochaetota bacterium]